MAAIGLLRRAACNRGKGQGWDRLPLAPDLSRGGPLSPSRGSRFLREAIHRLLLQQPHRFRDGAFELGIVSGEKCGLVVCPRKLVRRSAVSRSRATIQMLFAYAIAIWVALTAGVRSNRVGPAAGSAAMPARAVAKIITKPRNRFPSDGEFVRSFYHGRQRISAFVSVHSFVPFSDSQSRSRTLHQHT
jgi:hypothetical protein